MTRRKLIVRGVAGNESVEFAGEGLAWGTGQKRWTNFDRVTLRLADGRSWSFEAEPLSALYPAAVAGPQPSTDGKSSFHIYDPTSLTGSGQTRQLGADRNLWIAFHWINPLTPFGAGLWLLLNLRARRSDGRLEIAWTSTSPHTDYGSRIYHAKRQAPERSSDWEALNTFDPDWGSGDDYLFLDTFAARPWPYLKKGRLNVPLLDEGAEPWIAALGRRELVYQIGPIDAAPAHQAVPAALLCADADAVAVNCDALAAMPGASGNPAILAAPASIGGRVAHRFACARAATMTPTGPDAEAAVRDPARFVVDWTLNGRGAGGEGQLSLPLLWRYLTDHFSLGLASARARSRFTSLPTRLELSAERPMILRFESALRPETGAGGHARLRVILADLRQAGLGTDAPLTVRLGGAPQSNGSAPIFSLRVKDWFDEGEEHAKLRSLVESAGRRSPFPRSVLSLSSIAPARGEVDWVLGGVRVRASDLNKATLAVHLGDGGLLEQQPMGCDIELRFGSAALTPASQDPEPGFETLSAWLDRPRPIAIDLSAGSTTPLVLACRERAEADFSRILRIEARTGALGGVERLESDVVVIDPAPLTIARVQDRIEVGRNALVAEYSDDSESAAGWEYSVATGEMTITLPPQAIGEEMVKGRLKVGGVEVPSLDGPTDSRLSPPAVLEVDRTDIDTARTAPPWMLRRHLDRRIGVTGLKLLKARFELVYGLMTSVSTRGLRVAEMEGLIGRVPFADRMAVQFRRRRMLGPDSGSPRPAGAQLEPESIQQAYAFEQGRWILDLLRRPSRWPLFTDAADRRQLRLQEGVDVAQRSTRKTAHPFRLGETWDGSAGTPLRGGVDWMFQSPNIYDEFLRNPNSVEATVDGVAFGPLGGEGNQSAHFANGKTIVISRTQQGHLESLVLMRIGRIGMLWNHARHVIVYQRTARRAPRYVDDGAYSEDTYDAQGKGLLGYMALRKVREYVEITQPRRAYPDFRADLALIGPCRQSTFETVIIPVKASWARDVKQGQVITLRGPLRSDERKFFPWPKIFVELARAEEKGGGLIANGVADPSQLLFFTSTRAEDNGDTDSWPAWPDIDYPVLPEPLPPAVDYRPNFAGSRSQPDAARAEFGRGRFTIDLVPNEEAANLMHGRQANALDARVRNVTLARGRPQIVVPADSLQAKAGALMSEAAAMVEDRLAELRAHVRAHAAAETDPASPAHQQFKADVLALTTRIGGLLGTQVLDKLGEIKTGLTERTADWGRQQDRLAADYRTNAELRFAAAGGRLDDLRQALPSDLDEARSRAAAGFQEMAEIAKRQLNEFTFVPAQALAKLRGFLDRLEADALAAFTAAALLLADLAATARQAWAAARDEEAEIDARWRDAAFNALAGLRRLADDALGAIDDELAGAFAPPADSAADESIRSKLISTIRDALHALVDEADLQVAETPPFELGEPRWADLETIATLPADLDSTWLADAAKTWLDDLQAKMDAELAKALDLLKDAHKKIEDEVERRIRAIAGGDLTKIELELEAAAKAFRETWTNDLVNPIAAQLEKLKSSAALTALAGDFDAAKQYIAEASAPIDRLVQAIGKGSIDEIAREIDGAANELLPLFRRTLRHAEEAIAGDLLDRLERDGKPLLDMAGNPTLALERVLGTGTVTDTLGMTREALGYYYAANDAALAVTRASAIFNDLGAGRLNALSAMVPFDSIKDRLMPQLAGIDLSSIFPDFAGLKLEYLFPELKVALDELSQYDWLTIRHGFDRERLTAWSDVKIDKQFDDAPTLFALPPVSLTLGRAHLRAHCRVEVGTGDQRVQDISGSIKADWTLNLSGKPVVTLLDASLLFGNDGKFDFEFDSENIVLANELKFVTDALKQLLPQEEGLTITPALPAGISAELALPLPDIGTGAFTLTGITLFNRLALKVQDGFEVTVAFWLSKPDRPFGLAIVFLGGGGWVGAEVTYRPPGAYSLRISIGVSAGAFIAVNLGFARASAGILFTAGIDLYRVNGGGRNSTSISLGLLIWGDFSILSIAHAYMRITASITYTDSGGMIANGRFEVGIRISFFYTLRVRRDFTRVFKKGSGQSSFAAAALTPARAMPFLAAAEAIDCHFATLDVG